MLEVFFFRLPTVHVLLPYSVLLRSKNKPSIGFSRFYVDIFKRIFLVLKCPIYSVYYLFGRPRSSKLSDICTRSLALMGHRRPVLFTYGFLRYGLWF